MSATVKLAARLPGDEELNGIDHIGGSLVTDPTRLRYGIVVFRTLKITRNVELDTEVPTVEIERAEYVGDVDSVAPAVRDAFLEAARQRLGTEPLPYDETDPAGVSVHPDPDRDDPFLPDDDDGDL